MPPAKAAAIAPAPWFIAGGWAIDLFLGRKTREHADVDFALSRLDQDLSGAAGDTRAVLLRTRSRLADMVGKTLGNAP